MCGIAGVVEWGGRPIDPTVVARMGRVLRHRGPDETGVSVRQAADGSREASVGLAHTRLSIIDLQGGQQPLANAEETLWIVFNGELYNYQALREELVGAGYRFRTQSDTEVILHAYAAFGPSCVSRFRGMFAFAIWDAPQQRLVLARDRVGKKPLVYAQVADRTLFASEIQALVEHPELSGEVNWEAIHHYLTLLCIPAPWTAFRGVAKLPPGHLAIVEHGQVHLQRYWSLDPSTTRSMDRREAIAEVTRRMEESVRLRLVSDVPVGAFLSGGLDSSIVVSEMAAASAEPIQTFSVGFPEASFNELPFARQVAQRYRTRHTEFVVTPDAAAIMPELIRNYGEPFADSSAIPTYYVAQCARQHVKVVLSGDGGDELFGGYYRHLAMGWGDRYAQLPSGLRGTVLDSLMASWPAWLDVRAGRLSLKRLLRGISYSRRDRLLSWLVGFNEAEKRRLYLPDAARGHNGADTGAYFDPLWARVESRDGVNALGWVDFQWYLPSDLLVKTDIASMAHGLEVRCPWLDHPLAEFAMQVPASLKVRGRSLKYLLREAWREKLPPEILRRRKQGFAVPLARWLRGSLQPWMRELLLAPSAHLRAVLDPKMVAGLVEDHLRGRGDRSEQLWTLMMLELWFRVFKESRRTVGASC